MPDLQHTESSRSAATKRANRTSDQPKDWTIKGLPAKTVEITREAAKQNGMKINAWVSKALYEAAAESADETLTYMTADEMASSSSVNDEIARLRKQNEELVHTINSMTAILAKMYADKN